MAVPSTAWLAAPATRRTTLAALATAMAPRLLPTNAVAQPRARCRPLGRVCLPERGVDCCPGSTCRAGRCRCPRGKRRCGRDCIAASRCCRNRCGGGAACRHDRCVCPGRSKRCRGRCIPRAHCCRNRECGAGEACQRGRCRCRPGFQPCQGGCLPDRACCGGCPAGLTCREGTCCLGTVAALTAALASGPEVLRLCPDTTYQGSFFIERDVTIVGAGPGSTILDGGGTSRVVETAVGTTAALHGLSITNGNAGDDGGGGILNRGRITLAEVALTENRALLGAAIYTNPNDGMIPPTDTALTNCALAGNKAATGGAIFAVDARLTLTTCTLTGNLANNGGALFVVNTRDPSSLAVTLDACRLSGNTAADNGGTIHSSSDSDVPTSGMLTLRNGTRVGPSGPGELPNRAQSGDGITVQGNNNSLLLDASHVTGNVATFRPGGIHKDAPTTATQISIELVNGSTVRDNTPCDCNFSNGACEVLCT